MPAVDLGSYDWHGNVARIINAVGDRRLPVTLLSAISRLVPFEHTAIMRFDRADRPRDLLRPYPAGRFHSKYMAGNYRLDPFYRAARRRAPAGLFRMSDLVPDYAPYLDDYELGPSIADVSADVPSPRRDLGSGKDLREEIGFLFPQSGDAVIHIALIRSKASPAFSDREIARLKTIEPVIRAAAESHWRGDTAGTGSDAKGDEGPPAAGPPADAYKRLTTRECQVVREILSGHRTQEIAWRLGIAAGTVKIHRKNIYRKLGIASQVELFRMSFPAGDGRDRR